MSIRIHSFRDSPSAAVFRHSGSSGFAQTSGSCNLVPLQRERDVSEAEQGKNSPEVQPGHVLLPHLTRIPTVDSAHVTHGKHCEDMCWDIKGEIFRTAHSIG